MKRTIADLPDKPKFTIKVVCAQTGMRAVTLRAWERRYNLLSPHRTKGNYRLYSERDVALLRWLKGRVDSGVPISSAAAELEDLRHAGEWPEALPALRRQPVDQSAAAPREYARRLYDLLVAHDEAEAGAVLGEAHAVFDLTTVCVEVIAPCLVEVGEAWHRGAIRISTEHFASTFLQGRLLRLLQAYPLHSGAPHIIVGCAPGERHELGSLMVALLVRREGYRAEYLGADLYLDDLLDYARAVHPAMICLSATTDEPARALRNVQARLAGLRPRPKFGYGGRAFNLNPRLRSEVAGIYLGENAADASAAIWRALQA